jgi:hypothetical protein
LPEKWLKAYRPPDCEKYCPHFDCLLTQANDKTAHAADAFHPVLSSSADT